MCYLHISSWPADVERPVTSPGVEKPAIVNLFQQQLFPGMRLQTIHRQRVKIAQPEKAVKRSCRANEAHDKCKEMRTPKSRTISIEDGPSDLHFNLNGT